VQIADFKLTQQVAEAAPDAAEAAPARQLPAAGPELWTALLGKHAQGSESQRDAGLGRGRRSRGNVNYAEDRDDSDDDSGKDNDEPPVQALNTMGTEGSSVVAHNAAAAHTTAAARGLSKAARRRMIRDDDEYETAADEISDDEAQPAPSTAVRADSKAATPSQSPTPAADRIGTGHLQAASPHAARTPATASPAAWAPPPTPKQTRAQLQQRSKNAALQELDRSVSALQRGYGLDASARGAILTRVLVSGVFCECADVADFGAFSSCCVL
jgi:hypothetical protein